MRCVGSFWRFVGSVGNSGGSFGEMWWLIGGDGVAHIWIYCLIENIWWLIAAMWWLIPEMW